MPLFRFEVSEAIPPPHDQIILELSTQLVLIIFVTLALTSSGETIARISPGGGHYP
jgi:hypothetical protein